MEVIPIDSPQLTVFALSGSYAYACKRNMKMAGAETTRQRTVWFQLALMCVDSHVIFG